MLASPEPIPGSTSAALLTRFGRLLCYLLAILYNFSPPQPSPRARAEALPERRSMRIVMKESAAPSTYLLSPPCELTSSLDFAFSAAYLSQNRAVRISRAIASQILTAKPGTMYRWAADPESCACCDEAPWGV
ncbi:uncharacterized protein GGS25DRAFT_1603 [Hypoxylon fragiforme]|uniref:uncharacterized protein n=1 Tax=Hypoxylon fragiforme TaxID=63214 RepID=UPI0020C66AFA|nr:uncharacterized protein GGS25DRAFT_1603 [Hypoxylon fragiforme]KAI2613497.1 hypothetical protein GGS25DRAFT_1603 [Hypoxylon fragiforme]